MTHRLCYVHYLIPTLCSHILMTGGRIILTYNIFHAEKSVEIFENLYGEDTFSLL